MSDSSSTVSGKPSHWRAAAYFRRTATALLVLAQTFGAGYAMLGVLPYHGTTWLEQAILAVSAILFMWISAGFWMGVIGFFVRMFGGDRRCPSSRFPAAAVSEVPVPPTAILYPIYHEDVQRTLAGLRSTYLDLQRTGQGGHFSFFVLSDSRDPNVWLAEREACSRLRQEFGPDAPIHYRRRPINQNRKTGNISDFLRRWGRRFKYMIVMDADSVMLGETLVHMARIMESDGRIGILQTSPSLVNATSGHARVQQFANRLYGPLFSEGLAALQLGQAVYWGHNAIIRVEPFMNHCGLPHLPGWSFLTGSVLSHDFVEAAYIGRAGYEVWLDPHLQGSYEESPPTLLDELDRDRRWAHGNLQHLYFLFKGGIAFAHKMAFLNGIMSYLSSALWFTYLVLITLELAQFTLWPIDYFPDPYSPFPVWPQWQPQWAIKLAFGTLFLLFAPKVLSLLDGIFRGQTRRGMGGFFGLTFSVLLEMIVSILLAPIRMLSHTRYVFITLFNLKVRWAGQNRTEETTWKYALVRHAPGSILALTWAGFAYWLQPLFFYWSLPIAVPLILAAPVSVWLSRFRTGRGLRRMGLLLTPEETRPPQVLLDLQHAPRLTPETSLSAFEIAVLDPRRNHFHRELARHRKDCAGRPEKREALIRRCLEQGSRSLSAAERSWLVDDGKSLAELHQRAWTCPEGSRWAQAVDAYCQDIGYVDSRA